MNLALVARASKMSEILQEKSNFEKKINNWKRKAKIINEESRHCRKTWKAYRKKYGNLRMLLENLEAAEKEQQEKLR